MLFKFFFYNKLSCLDTKKVLKCHCKTFKNNFSMTHVVDLLNVVLFSCYSGLENSLLNTRVSVWLVYTMVRVLCLSRALFFFVGFHKEIISVVATSLRELCGACDNVTRLS